MKPPPLKPLGAEGGLDEVHSEAVPFSSRRRGRHFSIDSNTLDSSILVCEKVST